MMAQILDRQIRFEVELDASGRPPAEIEITVRTCWRKPPERLVLEYTGQDLDVAFYEEKGLRDE